MTLVPTDPSRLPRARRGPLAGVRVTDFCWMVVGAVATRLLADFGAEVIRIEDRNRLDLPRRLPLYKGGLVRSYGDEDANPDPNKGGMFNNCNRNKLGVTLNMRDPKGRELAERLIAESSVRDGELRAGSDGALGTHRGSRSPAPSRRDLRTDERVRAQWPVRRLPELRPGGPGCMRPVAHQRPAGARTVRLGTVVHGQPGRLLQLGRADDGDPRPQRQRCGHRHRRLGRRGGRRVARSGPARRRGQRAWHPSSRLSHRQPSRPSSRRTPRRVPHRRGRIAGWRSPCSTTTSGRR